MNEQRSSPFIDAIRDVIKESVQQLGATITLDAIIDASAERLKKRKDEVVAFVKLAWNYEEKYCLDYSLEEAVRWFKGNMPGDAVAGCLLRQRPRDGRSPHRLHHCFLGAGNVPLLDGQHPHRVVVTAYLSEDLDRHFGDKEMLVLK